LLPCCLVGCCQWSFLNSTLPVACCTSPVACCMLHVALHVVVVRCMLLKVLRVLPVARSMLFVVRCILPAAWHMLSGSCPLLAACRQVHFPRCMLHVVNCLLHIFQWSSAALLAVGSCLRAHSLLHIARSPLHDARPLSRVVAWPLPVPSCTSSVPCRMLPGAEWHCAITHAAHRGGARH
jgi:hypothetical protein